MKRPGVKLRLWVEDKEISRIVYNGIHLSGFNSFPLVFHSREIQKPGIFRCVTGR